MKKKLTLIIYLLFIQFLIIIMSCGGGFSADSTNADDIGNEIFGSDSTK